MTTKKEKISGGVPKNPVMKYLYLNKGILAGALGIFLVFGFLTEFKFWGRANVINILRITSLDSIAAFGVTLIIITGGIDLSVGALMACASTYCALLISNGLHPAGALLVGVLIATVFGAINGGIVANTKIPPFIVTLGTMNIGRGIAYTCSAGTPIRISGDFGEIGNGYFMWLQQNTGAVIGIAPLNPVSLLDDRSMISHVYRSLGNIQLDYIMPFLPELRANLNLGYDVSKSRQWNKMFPNSPITYKENKKLGIGQTETLKQLKRNQLLDFYLNWSWIVIFHN